MINTFASSRIAAGFFVSLVNLFALAVTALKAASGNSFA
jgi:hypothetical protein